MGPHSPKMESHKQCSAVPTWQIRHGAWRVGGGELGQEVVPFQVLAPRTRGGRRGGGEEGPWCPEGGVQTERTGRLEGGGPEGAGGSRGRAVAKRAGGGAECGGPVGWGHGLILPKPNLPEFVFSKCVLAFGCVVVLRVVVVVVVVL